MFKSYFKIMVRNMVRRKLYAAINVVGLTVAIAFALLVGVFIRGELHVNQDLPEASQIYLLESEYKENNGAPFFTPAPLLPLITAAYPEKFTNYYRFVDRQVTVSRDDQHVRLQSMIGDTTFVSMFGFRVLQGNGATALDKPNTLIITERVAKLFFNKTDVVGQTLTLATEKSGRKEFTINAVIADPLRKNSVTDFMNMQAEIFIPFSNLQDFTLAASYNDFWTSDLISYVKVGKGVNAQEADGLLNSFFNKNATEDVVKGRLLQAKPLTDYYQLTNHGSVRKLLLTLTTILVFILLLAICNFVNLSVAGSMTRLKETGVRKVIGGLRKQVVFQFLAESVAFSWFSGILALLVYTVLRSFAQTTMDTAFPTILEFDVAFWLIIVGGLTMMGFLAGIYPSVYLSAARPVDSLKGKFKSVNGAIYFSRFLISVQFMVSVFIFAGTYIMSRQVDFFLHTDLGYDRSAVLVVTSVPRRWSDEGYRQMNAAKKEFLNTPSVAGATLSTGSPSLRLTMGGVIAYRSGDVKEHGVNAGLTGTDEDFAAVNGLEVVAGTFFNSTGGEFPGDHIVINEALQKSINVQVGDKVKFADGGGNEFTVTGIVKDFHAESLHQAIQPLIFMHSKNYLVFRYFSFKLRPGDLTEHVRDVERVWHRVFPEDAFVAAFADDNIQEQYKTEMQLRKASGIATVLMLVIVLTGVLGLVSLTVAKRTKEIGIRKVLGANASNVLMLLGREYMIVMAAAFAVGIPLSYVFLSDWLDGFVYRITLQWWMFALPLVLLFVLTLMVVTLQGIKAVVANPVKSLRQE